MAMSEQVKRRNLWVGSMARRSSRRRMTLSMVLSSPCLLRKPMPLQPCLLSSISAGRYLEQARSFQTSTLGLRPCRQKLSLWTNSSPSRSQGRGAAQAWRRAGRVQGAQAATWRWRPVAAARAGRARLESSQARRNSNSLQLMGLLRQRMRSENTSVLCSRLKYPSSTQFSSPLALALRRSSSPPALSRSSIRPSRNTARHLLPAGRAVTQNSGRLSGTSTIHSLTCSSFRQQRLTRLLSSLLRSAPRPPSPSSSSSMRSPSSTALSVALSACSCSSWWRPLTMLRVRSKISSLRSLRSRMESSRILLKSCFMYKRYRLLCEWSHLRLGSFKSGPAKGSRDGGTAGGNWAIGYGRIRQCHLRGQGKTWQLAILQPAQRLMHSLCATIAMVLYFLAQASITRPCSSRSGSTLSFSASSASRRSLRSAQFSRSNARHSSIARCFRPSPSSPSSKASMRWRSAGWRVETNQALGSVMAEKSKGYLRIDCAISEPMSLEDSMISRKAGSTKTGGREGWSSKMRAQVWRARRSGETRTASTCSPCTSSRALRACSSPRSVISTSRYWGWNLAVRQVSVFMQSLPSCSSITRSAALYCDSACRIKQIIQIPNYNTPKDSSQLQQGEAAQVRSGHQQGRGSGLGFIIIG